jgi:arylsulfatase A-like enzyme
MPTFCALAGYQASSELKWDGVDIGPALRGSMPEETRTLYWTAPGFRSRAVRVGDWKLLVQGEGNARKVELYDLAQDPKEANNLADQQRSKVDEMLQRLEQVSAADRDAVAKN